MTDRHEGYIVVLDHSVREDDAKAILDAILMIKGVLSVRPVVGDPMTAVAEMRAKHKFFDALTAVLREDKAV